MSLYNHAALVGRLPGKVSDRAAASDLLKRFDPERDSYLVWRLGVEFGYQFVDAAIQAEEQLRVIAHVVTEELAQLHTLRDSLGWEGPISDPTEILGTLLEEARSMDYGGIDKAHRILLSMTSMAITSDDHSLRAATQQVEAVADLISDMRTDTAKPPSSVARAVYRYLTPELGDFERRRWQAIVDVDDLLAGKFSALTSLHDHLGPPQTTFRFLDRQILPPGTQSEARPALQPITNYRSSPTVFDEERLRILDRITERYPRLRDVLEPRFCLISPSSRVRERLSVGDALANYHVLEIEVGPKIFAVAASPMTGQDAIYIVRSDVSSAPWQEVLTQTKQRARDLGAKTVRVTGDSGVRYSQAADRVIAYLTCPAHSFRSSTPVFYEGRWSVGEYW
ncbi:hypothetical protein ACQ7HM_10410 [Williamsia sp. MIQD14]|uniref:hypothetical protein n=1 Tax=Williamsia sp. MIQD14 TaxID=3425703 RepID=UPI003DA03ED3